MLRRNPYGSQPDAVSERVCTNENKAVRKDDVREAKAVFKSEIADRNNTLREGDVHQAAAVCKGAVTHGNDAVREADFRKADATGKSMITDGNNTVRNVDLLKGMTARKSRITDGNHAFAKGGIPEAFAIFKNRLANESDSSGNGDVRKVIAASKSRISDRHNARRNDDPHKTFTVIKSIVPDRSNPLGNHNVRRIIRKGKRPIPNGTDGMTIQFTGNLYLPRCASVFCNLSRAILQQNISIIPTFIRFSRSRLYILRRRTGSETQQKEDYQQCDTSHFYGPFSAFGKVYHILSRKIKNPMYTHCVRIACEVSPLRRHPRRVGHRAAQAHVPVIEHHALPGRDRALELVRLDQQAFAPRHDRHRLI